MMPLLCEKFMNFLQKIKNAKIDIFYVGLVSQKIAPAKITSYTVLSMVGLLACCVIIYLCEDILLN